MVLLHPVYLLELTDAPGLDERGEVGDGWSLVDGPGRSLDRERLRHQSHQLRCDQRVASDVEEAVVQRQPRYTQHPPEDGLKGALDLRLGVVDGRRRTHRSVLAAWPSQFRRSRRASTVTGTDWGMPSSGSTRNRWRWKGYVGSLTLPRRWPS